jgi:hypothetical protein
MADQDSTRARDGRKDSPIPNDAPCPECGQQPELRACWACHVEAWITDCGHMGQPRPIAPGRISGLDMHRVFCRDCAL